MANLEWNGGVCPAQPGLPNLLLLSLELVGVRDPPEFVYREYERYGTLRCKVLIFVGRSTLYPNIDPGSSPPLGFVFKTPTRRLPGRPCDVYEWFIGSISEGLKWDFSHPQEVEDAHGLTE
jgi:hypothetical protein